MKQNFTILSEKLLDRLLEVDSNKIRSKSGITPPAQSPTLLQSNSRQDPIEMISARTKERIKNKQPELYYLIEFMSATGCRISEALAIRSIDITRTGFVKLKALKGSKNRVVHSGMSAEYLIKCSINQVQPWQGWNRWFVYRQFKSLGIQVQTSGNKNKSVTHAFRHIVAESIESAGMTIEDSKQVLGHKSINSTKHYHGKQSKRV